ncbi:MAG: ribosome-associated translation inhibitor RaiA [Rhodospirillaceae bacterium]|jgi:ribosomal subunit interface protein
MDISVQGKHVDVGDALRAHATDHLDSTVTKYFNRALNASVTFSKDGQSFRADISVHAGRGLSMQGSATHDDAYTAFDQSLERISKQLRRYKRRLTDHHRASAEDTEVAQQYVIAPEQGDEVPEDSQPVIIAEMPHEIATLTVSQAVMHMDLSDLPLTLFRNRAHGGINVVYRRADGNIGWIDPNENQQTKSS